MVESESIQHPHRAIRDHFEFAPRGAVSCARFASGPIGTSSPTTDLALANPGQGWSHLPTFTADTHDFGVDSSVPVEDDYVHHFTLTDGNGNGWNITGSSAVTPEPGVALLVARRWCF